MNDEQNEKVSSAETENLSSQPQDQNLEEPEVLDDTDSDAPLAPEPPDVSPLNGNEGVIGKTEPTRSLQINNPQPMDDYLDPARFNQMYKLASVLFNSKCFTKDCINVEQVFVKLQAGREMGLMPMETMNDLCLIYGHTTFWGAGLAKRFRRFGYKIEYKEEVSNFDYKTTKGQKASHQLPPDPRAVPTIERGRLDPEKEDRVTVVVTNERTGDVHSYKVTLSEVEALNSNALKISRKDKLRYHGLARIARQELPEVLGSIHYIAEEVTPDMAIDNIEKGLDKKQTLREKKAK